MSLPPLASIPSRSLAILWALDHLVPCALVYEKYVRYVGI